MAHTHRWTHCPSSISLGLGLGLWLMTANSFNSSQPFTVTEQQIDSAPTSISQTDIVLLDSAYHQQQRELFKKADQAFELGRRSEFKRLLPQLTRYPLYPYLVYKNMRRNISKLDQQQIELFLDDYDNSIITDQFRRDLIRYYARHQQWQSLIQIYTPQDSTSLQCKYLYALLQTGDTERAYPAIEKLWLNAQSLHRNCDQVFKHWSEAGQQTQALTWQRIELAMAKNHIQLARHLAKQLNSDEQIWFKLWMAVHRDPEVSLESDLLKEARPLTATIRLHAIKRMSRKDTDQAITLWMKLAQRYSFTEASLYQVYEQIGLVKARRHETDANFWLDRIPEQYANQSIHEWRVRTAIRQANWPGLVNAIEQLPPHQQAELRWQYWWAYANEQMGYSQVAEGIYHNLANRRSFYGFLAADYLGLPYSFEERPVQADGNDMLKLSKTEQAQRARELFKLKRIPEARREWHQLMASLDEQEKLLASKLAQQWGWHDRAIFTMGRTEYRDDIALRFPLPLLDKVTNWSEKNSIDPALTYAIIRRESAFMSDAKSSKGALGLMQIQPRTARSVARNMKIRYRGKNSLLKTDTNLKLGTGYLQQMLKRHDSQAVLATAAYNAGPHRVKAWLPDYQPMEAIRWIETIPFRETREYVSNVLAYIIIYEYVMGSEPSRLQDRMPPVQPRFSEAQATQPLEPLASNNQKI
ncbi:MAG: transglycosylase SLT domain-containing protein [Gammaproteobacteria bacterium]|nr:transglycosylase SLT domain-containing protein [Gammaproteobacteria bacterium]